MFNDISSAHMIDCMMHNQAWQRIFNQPHIVVEGSVLQFVLRVSCICARVFVLLSFSYLLLCHNPNPNPNRFLTYCYAITLTITLTLINFLAYCYAITLTITLIIFLPTVMP